MEPSSQVTDLARLEQAELAARERRLSASTQAEALVAAAHARASAILAEASAQEVEALEQYRARTADEADRAIRALEAAAETAARARDVPSGSDPSIQRAVGLVVAAVLGEAPVGGA